MNGGGGESVEQYHSAGRYCIRKLQRHYAFTTLRYQSALSMPYALCLIKHVMYAHEIFSRMTYDRADYFQYLTPDDSCAWV